MTIRNRKMIAEIIDYLDLPLSKKATEIRYYDYGKAFIIYGDRSDVDYKYIQVNFSLDVDVDIWGGITLELYSSDKPTTTLVLEQDNFKVRSCYNFQGYLQYGNLHIDSLD